MTWDWRDTTTGCPSADPHVLAEQGSKKVVSLKPDQVRQVRRRSGGRTIRSVAGGVYNSHGPFGFVDGSGRVAVHAVQVVQLCKVTGTDETGDPTFGPDGGPITDTCDTTVSGSFRLLAFLPKLGRRGRSVGADLREEIGAEPDCSTHSGLGILGPEPLGGSIPPKRVALSRFYPARGTVSLRHTRSRGQATADSTIVGTTTTRAKLTLRRLLRPEPCFHDRRSAPAVRRHFVCTPQ
jgi:hypothetical protein